MKKILIIVGVLITLAVVSYVIYSFPGLVATGVIVLFVLVWAGFLAYAWYRAKNPKDFREFCKYMQTQGYHLVGEIFIKSKNHTKLDFKTVGEVVASIDNWKNCFSLWFSKDTYRFKTIVYRRISDDRLPRLIARDSFSTVTYLFEK